MKHILLFTILAINFCLAQKKDNRTLEEINDSILKEANLIYRYDAAFVKANQLVELEKKLRKNVGEVFVYNELDSLKVIVIDKKDPKKILAELKIKEPDDEVALKQFTRTMTEEEFRLINIKYLMFAKIQEDFELQYSNDEFFTPVFIPFKVIRKGKELELFKLYLITETSQPRTIPFGRDYLFYGKADGKVFYNLQFNQFMPVKLDGLTYDSTEVIEIEYPEREPYITPTDVFLFMKYAQPLGLNNLHVQSTKLNKLFRYNADRELIFAPEE